MDDMPVVFPGVFKVRRVFTCIAVLCVLSLLSPSQVLSSTSKNVEKPVVTASGVPRSWIGIQFVTITEELAEKMNLARKDGVLIKKVFPNSPALKAGIKEGDIVQEANGKKVYDCQDIPKLTRTLSPGDVLRLRVARLNTELNIDIVLERLDEASSPQLMIAKLKENALNYHKTGKNDLAIQTMLNVKEMHEKHFGRYNGEFLDIVALLLDLYKIKRDFRAAEQMAADAVGSVKVQYGEGSEAHINSYSFLAALYEEIGNYDKAEQCYRKSVVPMTMAKFGRDSAQYRNALQDLSVLLRRTGRQSEIRALYSDIPEYYLSMEKFRGELEAADARDVFWRTLRLIEASNGFEASLYLKGKIAGSDRGEGNPDPWYLACEAILSLKEGNYDNAYKLYGKAFDLTKKKHGKESVEYVRILAGYSFFYYGDQTIKWRLEGIGDPLEEGSEILKKIGRDRSVEYAEILDLKAKYLEYDHGIKMLKSDTLLSEARDLREQAKDILKQSLIDNELLYAEHLTREVPGAAMFNPKMDWNQRFREGMAIQKKLLGENHPRYAVSLINYAQIVLPQQLRQSATDAKNSEKLKIEILNTYTKAIKILESTIGKDNPYYCKAIFKLSESYYNTSFSSLLAAGHSHLNIQAIGIASDVNRVSHSIKLLMKAVSFSEAVYGKKHPQYLIRLSSLLMDNNMAIELCEEALIVQKETFGERSAEYASTMMIASSRYKQRYMKGKDETDFQRAEELMLGCRDIFARLLGDDTYNYSNILKGVADFYQEKDRQKALKVYEHVLEIQKRTVGEMDYRYALGLLGYSQFFIKSPEPDYRKAIGIYNKITDNIKANRGVDDPMYKSSMNTLAWLYEQIADYGKADEIRKNARQLGNNTVKERDKSHLLFVISSQIDLGEYEKARESLLGMLSNISDDELAKEPLTYSNAQYYMGMVCLEEKSYERAEKYFLQSFDTLKRFFKGIDIDNLKFFGTIRHFGLAQTYRAKGEYGKAEEHYKKVIEIEGIEPDKGVAEPGYAYYLSGLGNLYLDRKEYQKAEQTFRNVLEVYSKAYGEGHPDYSNAAIESANVYGLMGDHDKSLEYFCEGLSTLDNFVSSMALWATEARMQSYLAKVDRSYDRFYSLAAQYYAGSQDRNAVYRILQTHLNYKGKTLEILSTRNRLALYSRDDKLGEIINGLKSVTQDLAALAFSGPAGGMSLDMYRFKMDKLARQKEQLEEELAKRAAEFADKKALAKIRVEDVAAALPVGGAYLDFIEYDRFDYGAGEWSQERHYLGFLLGRDATGEPVMKIVDLGSAATIDPLIDDLRAILKSGFVFQRGLDGKRTAKKKDPAIKASESEGTSSKLYRILLGPFQKEIDQARILCISPSANLNLLPFEALSVPGSKDYLGDRAPVIYGIGRDILRGRIRSAGPNEKRSVSKLVILAGPDYSKDLTPVDGTAGTSTNQEGKKLVRGDIRGWPIEFDALPGTLEEAKVIIKLAGNGNVDSYTGSNATEKVIKMVRNPRILHVATHGFFLEDVGVMIPENAAGPGKVHKENGGDLSARLSMRPAKLRDPLLRSGLAFAGANRLARGQQIAKGQEDGILTAAEVTGIDLNGTELVVLSACDTGLGEIKRGNGVSGLRRAFKIAGAQNIIMSLWSVPDVETSWLMEEFYRNYLNGDNSAVALNKAKAALRKRLIERDGKSDPYYWAAFVLEGAI